MLIFPVLGLLLLADDAVQAIPVLALLLQADDSLTRDNPGKKYDVQVGGVSLTTLILYVRELFGLVDSRISGEITVEHAAAGAGKDAGAKKFAMRPRITNKGHVEHEAEATDKLETLFEQTALKLVERFDPLNAAYYSYYKRDFDNARRIVRGYLTDPSPKNDAEWAANLPGLLEYARYRNDLGRAESGLDKAITELRKLHQSEPKFAPGLYRFAGVHRAASRSSWRIRHPTEERGLCPYSRADLPSCGCSFVSSRSNARG